MTPDNEYIDRLRTLVERDGRYKLEAVLFLHEALDNTLKMVGERRHVSGQELLEGFRALAIERYGMMASILLKSWGITTTDDVGEIVFLLVDNHIWGKTDMDSRDDFRGVFDFHEVFEEAFSIGPTLRNEAP